MAISPEIIFVFGGNNYNGAEYVAIPMVLDAFILFVYSIIVQGEYYTQKTIWVMIGTLVAAVIYIVLNIIFIPKFGYIAAAYTTLFAYLCYLVLHIVISKKLIGFFVIKLKWIIVFSLFVSGSMIFYLFFVDSLLLRWFFCFITVLPLATYLILNWRKTKNVNLMEDVL